MERFNPKGRPVFDKRDSYSPAEAKRAYDQLDQLVARKKMTARQLVRIADTSLAAFN